MKLIATAIAITSVLPAISALLINTPTGVVPCQPILLTYGSGTPPYYLSVLPGGQVSGAPLHVWDPTSAESMTWVVDLPSGTTISLAVKDSTGAQAYSDTVTIQGNGDTSCLNSAASSNAALASSAATRAASSGAASGSHAASGGGSTTVAATAGAHPAVTQSASSNAVAGGTGSSNAPLNDARRATVGAYGVGVGAAVGILGAMFM